MEPFIDEPGVYDLPSQTYHADPVVGGSLSSTGAKLLLLPNAPALFKYSRDNGQEHKRAYDVGHVTHTLTLGVGEAIAVIDAESYKSKKAQQDRDAAYAAGAAPVLAKEYEQCVAMAAAIRAHGPASALLHPDSGTAEQTLIWRDPDEGIMCRALVDWLRRDGVLVDVKTADEVDPASIARAIASYCYHGQGDWYRSGAFALGLTAELPPFVLIFVRKKPPHLVTCAQLHPADLGRGYERNRKAREIYRRCVETDRWPAYADDAVISVEMASWGAYQHDAASDRGEFMILEGLPI